MPNVAVNSNDHEIYRVSPWREIDDLLDFTVSDSRHIVSCRVEMDFIWI